MTRRLPWLLLVFAACSSPQGPVDGGHVDGGHDDAGQADAGHPPAADGGFIFHGPLDAGLFQGSSAYAMSFNDGGIGGSATIGSRCATGNDCAALGAGAGCLNNGDAGFCTVECPGESDSCDAGFVCARGLASVGGDLDGLCLPLCSTEADCAGSGPLLTQCSGPFYTFQPGFPVGGPTVCFPACSSDSDCNGEVCNPNTHRCADPASYVGSECSSDADCRNLGPAGSCLENARNPGKRYCTVACDAAIASDCVSGYATLPDGGAVAVQLRSCGANIDCQRFSDNTCNDFPEQGLALCSVRCASDADCVSGTCDVPTGRCLETELWGTRCEVDDNCSTGLCVSDFHKPGNNCTDLCGKDGDCPASMVCVFSPSAHLDNRGADGDAGFCAYACASDGGTCADSTTQCLPPKNPPEIDFAGSGFASGNFCWR